MSIFKQFLISIYQFERYNELVGLKAAKVVFYEIVLFIITTAVSFFPFISVFVGYGGAGGIVERFVPDFKIENGVLEAESAVFDENGMLIIIDGNNTRNEFDLRTFINLKGAVSGIIFDREKIIANNGLKTQTITYADFLNSLGKDKFEKSDIFKYISLINTFFVMFFVFSIAIFIFLEVIGILFLSVFALIMNLFFKKNIDYLGLLKISVYARSLSAVMSAGFIFIGISLDFIFVAVLNLAYIFFAIKKYKLC